MYYPKSQIVTDLYTNGDKYALQSTPNTPYTGYYYVVSTGGMFSGKNPNDGIPQRLVLLSTKEYSSGANSSPDDFSYLSSDYDTVRQQNGKPQSPNSLLEPNYIQPIPQYPSFTRYFVKKVNELQFIETSSDIYNRILSKDNRYNWPVYIPFTILWTTSGESANTVAQINKNIVSLEEQRKKLYGLSNYFKNYSEFYR
jgi:hypothetical protein